MHGQAYGQLPSLSWYSQPVIFQYLNLIQLQFLYSIPKFDIVVVIVLVLVLIQLQFLYSFKKFVLVLVLVLVFFQFLYSFQLVISDITIHNSTCPYRHLLQHYMITQLQVLYFHAVVLKSVLTNTLRLSFKHAGICSDLLILFLRPAVSNPQTENTRSTQA